ncbi:hypothetical protein GCM10009779_03400 [Polymorphospora rubra]|uniref:Tetratricopeptide repeat protein n=2 Tax=Polymorphospora rubra TaxID=338584 RepID=A0A810N1Q2_9ACTN|nr:hypothetical protein Prubr_26390 [Polymorphospora rubra]
MYTGTEGLRTLIADIMIATASLFIRIGETRAAVELTEQFKSDSTVIRMPGAALQFADNFIPSGYLSEAFDLIREMIDARSEELREVAQLVMMSLFMHRGPGELSGADYEEMVARLERRASIELEEGRADAAGRTLYSLGEKYRGSGDWEKALSFFDAALTHDPTYSNRGYFWRARGSVHYELKDYDAAANDYREAVRCRDATESAFLLSDVLLRAGRYSEALSVPVRSGATDFYALGERINRRVLATIIEVTGLSEQERNPLGAGHIAEIHGAATSEEIVAALRETDALDPRLWFLLGESENEMEDAQRSEIWLVAADLERDNPHLWAIAASMSILFASENMANDVCDSGLKWCDDEFLNLIEEVRQLFPDDASSAISTKVYERADRDHPRPTRTVRMVHEDGTYAAFEFSR